MVQNYLDSIEMRLVSELGIRAKVRDGMTPTIKKASLVVDIDRAGFPLRSLVVDAATAHEFRRACVRWVYNIGQGLDFALSLWAARPAEVVGPEVVEAARLDSVLVQVKDTFGAKCHPSAWSAFVGRWQGDGMTLSQALQAAILYWVSRPRVEGEEAFRALRYSAQAQASPTASGRPGRPARESAVVPIMTYYEAPLAGRLRRVSKRLGMSQREILHQALEAWLRAQSYPVGDPDAGGPRGREVEPLEVQAQAQAQAPQALQDVADLL